MSAILEIPEVRRRVSPISVEDYHRMGEFNDRGRRTELIRGVIVEKMSKSPLHCLLAQSVYDLLVSSVPEGFMVRREDPLTLKDSEPEPDVSVVRGAKKDFCHAHLRTAELVVEVAVSSVELDRENALLYAEAGVKEYWIVLGEKKQVEVYRRPHLGVYQEKELLGTDAALSCASLPGVNLRLAELFD